MDIARSDNGFTHFFSELNYLLIKCAQLIIIRSKPLSHEEGIVADGLYLKIIIE